VDIVGRASDWQPQQWQNAFEVLVGGPGPLAPAAVFPDSLRLWTSRGAFRAEAPALQAASFSSWLQFFEAPPHVGDRAHQDDMLFFVRYAQLQVPSLSRRASLPAGMRRRWRREATLTQSVLEGHRSTSAFSVDTTTLASCMCPGPPRYLPMAGVSSWHAGARNESPRSATPGAVSKRLSATVMNSRCQQPQ
jgi:hypothetical protein